MEQLHLGHPARGQEGAFPKPSPTVLPGLWLTLPLSGRQEAWGGEADCLRRPVHSRGLLGIIAGCTWKGSHKRGDSALFHKR